MKMYKCKSPWYMSEFISNKSKILQIKISKKNLEDVKLKTSINKITTLEYLDWSMFRKFITKHFLISIFIQTSNNQNMDRTWLHINLANYNEYNA